MGAPGARERCLNILRVRRSRCWCLALLAIMNFMIVELLWYSVDYHRNKSSWKDSTLSDFDGNIRFLNMDLEETRDYNYYYFTDDAVLKNYYYSRNSRPLSLCASNPPTLVGPLRVERNVSSLEEQELKHKDIELGGHYTPPGCKPRHLVAIIIPYRDRRRHLTALINHLHPMLKRQLIEYNIYVVEQGGSNEFNRGILMNIGVVEALEQYPYNCLILHDVDLVPENDRNMYTCSDAPRHMAASISSHNYTLMYSTYFGGVTALTTAQYKAINGFSNEFWGWGGEDDDFYNRVKTQKFNVTRYSTHKGRYTMLSHKHAKPNPTRHRLLRRGKRRYKRDGLSNLKYEILKTERRHLFTWMLVGVHRPSYRRFRFN